MIPIPKSIAYKNLDEEGMREFHESTLRFLRTEHAGRVLWPHLDPQGRLEAMEAALAGFE